MTQRPSRRVTRIRQQGWTRLRSGRTRRNLGWSYLMMFRFVYHRYQIIQWFICISYYIFNVGTLQFSECQLDWNLILLFSTLSQQVNLPMSLPRPNGFGFEFKALIHSQHDLWDIQMLSHHYISALKMIHDEAIRNFTKETYINRSNANILMTNLAA